MIEEGGEGLWSFCCLDIIGNEKIAFFFFFGGGGGGLSQIWKQRIKIARNGKEK